MPTPCENPDQRPSVESTAAPVASSVAADLEAIFPHEPRTQPSQTLRLRARRRRSGGREPSGAPFGRAGAAGALAAAALAGVSAGAWLGRSAPPANHAPRPVLQAKVVALPSPGPLPTGPLHAPQPERILAAEARPAASPSPEIRKVSVQRRHAAATRRASCHGAHCRTPSVMAADTRLRHAYAAARRAGVSSTVLADYRDRWEALRHRAPREPRLVAARYDDMAGDLNRMAARHEAEGPPSHPGPWRTLRTQIAALWR